MGDDGQKKIEFLEGRLAEVMAKSKDAAIQLGALIRTRREQAGLSQADLAAKVKSSQQTIDRIERGETKHSRAFPKILFALDISEDRAFSELAHLEAAFEDVVTKLRTEYSADGPPVPEFPAPSDVDRLSVYSLVEDGGLLYFDGIPADYVARPEPLMRVRKGYALIIPNDENAPVFRAGDVIFMNPHLPVRKDNEAVFTRRTGDRGRHAALIATVIGVTDTHYNLRTANGDHSIAREEWPSANVVVAKFNRT